MALLATSCSGGGKDAPEPTATAEPRIPSLRGEPADLMGPRAWPRWEDVRVLNGAGALTTANFDIVRGAIQWRVRWQCEAGGRLRVNLEPPPKKPGPLVDGACPGQGEGFSIEAGQFNLNVEAAGPWRLVVQQQVDTPLNEPPLAEMQAPTTKVLAGGPFYGVDKTGKGRAVLYRLPAGRLALRFEDFEVPGNSDLFVWASTAPQPKNSQEMVAAPYQVVGELKSTVGTQNYLLPPGVKEAEVRSVIIWCEPQRFAYAAAALLVPPPPSGVTGE